MCLRKYLKTIYITMDRAWNEVPRCSDVDEIINLEESSVWRRAQKKLTRNLEKHNHSCMDLAYLTRRRLKKPVGKMLGQLYPFCSNTFLHFGRNLRGYVVKPKGRVKLTVLLFSLSL